MSVGAEHVGKPVRWTRGRGVVGILHRLPVPGSVEWLRSRGKATVLMPPRPGCGTRSWAQISPAELEPVEDYDAPPAGHGLDLLAVEVPAREFIRFDAALRELLERHGARIVARQGSGSNLSLVDALHAFHRYEEQARRV